MRPPLAQRPRAFFLDIDGVLLWHRGTLEKCLTEEVPYVLPGVKHKLEAWHARGDRIILTTGRPESHRAQTEAQLRSVGLFWDQLVMGLPGGERILINDLKLEEDTPTARTICVPRNQGLKDVDI